MLTLTTSFYGRENPGLTDELCTELPGIFNWSLAGLDRLRARRRFQQPASGTDAIRELEDLASPVGAFVRYRCQVGPEREVDVSTLWAAWKGWCDDNGRTQPGTKQTFGRELRAAVPGVQPDPGDAGEGGQQFRQRRDGPAPSARCRRRRSVRRQQGVQFRASQVGVLFSGTCVSLTTAWKSRPCER